MRNFHDTDLPGVNNGNISVKVTYLGDDLDIFVESNPGDFSEQDLCQAVAKKNKKFPVSHLLGYFKIKDGEGNLVTKFLDYLKIQISYSPLAWELAKNNGHPRVGHIARSGDNWGEEWEEFKNKDDEVIVEVIPPSDKNPYGHVIIMVKSLPDPLIGDC